MLTKDLLRYRSRKSELKPIFLDPSEEGLLAFIQELLASLKVAEGNTREAIEEDLSLLLQAYDLHPKVSKALFKIAVHHAKFESLQAQGFRNARLRVFEKASLMRRECESLQDLEDFRSRVLQLTDYSANCPATGTEDEGVSAPSHQWATLFEKKLYVDLPAYDRLLEAPQFSSDALIARYNLELAQGFILCSKKLLLEVRDTDPAEKRRLFRYMKFFGITPSLRAGPEDKSSQVQLLELEGPLSVLEGSKSYAFQLACFLPAILKLKSWKLFLEVELPVYSGSVGKSQELTMVLTEENKLFSHFEHLTAHVPENLSVFKDSFVALQSEWNITECAEIIQTSDGEYCFPDYVFKFGKKMKHGIYAEVFHAWHKGPLLKRLKLALAMKKDLSKSSKRPKCKALSQERLLLAIEKKLVKDPVVQSLLEELDNKDEGTFSSLVFSQFLNPKTVLKSLQKLAL